jgi:CBS domain-containing protein
MRTVADVMTRDVVVLHEMDSLARIEDVLERRHIRHLPVVRGRQVVGLVTHRDLLRALGERAVRGPGEATRRAMDVMQRDVTHVRPHTPLSTAMRLVLENRFGCLPVVDSTGCLVGIVTEADLLRVALALLEDVDRHEQSDAYRA